MGLVILVIFSNLANLANSHYLLLSFAIPHYLSLSFAIFWLSFGYPLLSFGYLSLSHCYLLAIFCYPHYLSLSFGYLSLSFGYLLLLAGIPYKYNRCHTTLGGLGSACAKLEPASLKNNEVLKTNVLQKFTLNALFGSNFHGYTGLYANIIALMLTNSGKI